MEIDIRKPLKKYRTLFLDAQEAGLNEADTVLRLCRFFEEVLGYDGIHDVSREAEMKHKYVDICLKIDGRVRLLVEVKAAGQQLRDRHIEQAQAYASQNNYRWVVLTNGVDWHLYHLTFEEGIEYERAFVVSLAEAEAFDDAAQKIALLHKRSLAKGGLDAFWDETAALGPASIGKALFQQTALVLLRREIRKDTGILIDTEDLARALHKMLSEDAREQVGPLRIRRPRKRARQVKPKEQPAGTEAAQ